MSLPDFLALHEAACARGDATYSDPQTGYTVFTKLGLLARDRCCGAGCRHCPFDHESVPMQRRAARIQQAAWLSDDRPDTAEEIAILFWSGGKDSYLAHRSILREGRFAPVLLATFDPQSREIPYQGTHIAQIVEQAEALQLPLIGAPIHQGADYTAQLASAFNLLTDVRHLVFPDIGSEPVRKWREDTFSRAQDTSHMELHFPLWGTDYARLLEELAETGVRFRVSGISDGLAGLQVGETFDAEFCSKLPAGVDTFGINGEFYTQMVMPDPTFNQQL